MGEEGEFVRGGPRLSNAFRLNPILLKYFVKMIKMVKMINSLDVLTFRKKKLGHLHAKSFVSSLEQDSNPSASVLEPLL